MFLPYLFKYSIRIVLFLLCASAIMGILYLPAYTPVITEKSLNVFAWSGMLDAEYMSVFEQETGIKVNLSYFESNEELLVKLRSTGGKGYDLILPSDYAVALLRQENLLKPIDKSKLSFYKNIDPVFLSHYYDPDNTYSIPFEWAIYGIGINKRFFADKNLTTQQNHWSLLFNPASYHKNYKVVMVNDPIAAFPMASLYLFGTMHNLSQEQVNAIKKTLRNQRNFVEVYTDFRSDEILASNSVPVAATTSSYIARGMKYNKDLDFIVPAQSLITIEHFAIPAASNKQELAYKFIEFMYKPKTIIHHFNTMPFFPVTPTVLDSLNIPASLKSLVRITPEQFKKLSFLNLGTMHTPITEQFVRSAWIEIKS